MVMLAEQFEFVIGGDPDRDTIDLAVLDTGAGRVHAHLVDAADGAGYRRMLTWAVAHAPGRRIWALEGTGSFAAGWSCSSPRPVKRLSRSAPSSGPVERRMIGSMRSGPLGKPSRATSRAHPELVACGRRFGWYSLAEKGF